MPTSPTPAADRPAEGPLGPITPIRCTKPGCHWACHGVPDKYADSRARIVREHLAAEHAPTPEPSPAAVWVDGDPLMEAMAAAVYEQCGTDPVSSIVVDDPRNIAAVAASVARQLLGTTETEGALGPADGQQKMRLLAKLHASLTPIPAETDEEREQREDREEAARLHAAGVHQYCDVTCEVAMPTEAMRNFVIAKGYPGTAGALDELLRRAAVPPAPADRAAVLREGAASVESSDVTYDTEAASAALTNGGPFALVAYVQLAIGAHLRRLADDAAAGVQPPTSEADDTDAQQAAVVRAIRDFQFDNYGLDDIDPNSEYAEWVGDLASSIVGALPAAPAAPEEPTR